MYTTCTFCYQSLGQNTLLESCSVGRRVAYDPARGCVWVICPQCGRWNLAPMAERWEVTDECERRVRHTTLRYSSGNIGLAWLADDLELVRVGPALRPELAAWRYGRRLVQPRTLVRRVTEGGVHAASRLLAVLPRAAWHAGAGPRGRRPRDSRAMASRVLARWRGDRVLDVVQLTDDRVREQRLAPPALAGAPASTDRPLAVVRHRHLLVAGLSRPAPGQPWALHLPHDHGVLTVAGDAGVRLAARLLSVVNGSEHGGGISRELLEQAVRKVDESAQEDSYFNRVLSIALRTNWGRDAASLATTETVAPRVPCVATSAHATSAAERLAFALTGRTFWGNGGIGSEPATALLDIPLVDRLALEMAAHEESERRALDGELAELAEAWRVAAEIAAIADALLPV